jgi:hypothetical protein
MPFTNDPQPGLPFDLGANIRQVVRELLMSDEGRALIIDAIRDAQAASFAAAQAAGAALAFEPPHITVLLGDRNIEPTHG